jgi:RNA polymerase sigma-70 factor, ECF subfamily
MKVGRRILTDVPNGAAEMVLVLELPLPVKAPAQAPGSLAQFIERAAAGDKTAFEQIMIVSQQRVMSMTWRMLGNEADARDATQEVFLRVYKYLGRFRQDRDFFAWLYRVTVNVCHDFLKQRRQHTDRFLPLADETEQAALNVAVDQDDAEQAAIQTQQRVLMTRAMTTLPYKERAAIVLRDLEGLSTEEVARIMKSRPATVRSQISSARRKIRIYCNQYLTGKEREKQ